MAKLTLDDEDVATIAARVAAYLSKTTPAPTPTPVPPVPPPVPQGIRISARWDALKSQWAKWNFITPSETVTLQSLYGVSPVAQHINWYQSTARLDGKMNPDGTYQFVDKYLMGSPVWVPDVNGAADAKHASILRGVPEIAPLG